MKKIISLLNIIFLTKVASAYNGYGSFSFSEFLAGIDQSMIIIGAIFIVMFSLLFFSLSRVFKSKDSNPAIPAMISFALALLLTYWINKSGLDIEGLFSGIGISAETLNILVPLLAIGLAIILIVKLKAKALIIIGLLLIGISLTELIYEKLIPIVVGVVLTIIGILIATKKKKKKKIIIEE